MKFVQLRFVSVLLGCGHEYKFPTPVLSAGGSCTCKVCNKLSHYYAGPEYEYQTDFGSVIEIKSGYAPTQTPKA